MNEKNAPDADVKVEAPANAPDALPQALDGLVQQAVEESATDVHIDAWGNEAVVRFRVDGTVHEKDSLTYDQARKLINSRGTRPQPSAALRWGRASAE